MIVLSTALYALILASSVSDDVDAACCTIAAGTNLSIIIVATLANTATATTALVGTANARVSSDVGKRKKYF